MIERNVFALVLFCFVLLVGCGKDADAPPAEASLRSAASEDVDQWVSNVKASQAGGERITDPVITADVRKSESLTYPYDGIINIKSTMTLDSTDYDLSATGIYRWKADSKTWERVSFKGNR